MLELSGYQNNFVWWMGVVEDRMDPERLGRCRVRIFGFHPTDKGKVPTEDLPWSHPIMPLNSASISGIGETPLGPVEGTHVFGFFRDGENAQYPVMMGTIPGIPQSAPDVSSTEESGFQDPGEKYPKNTERHGINESDVSQLARYRWTDWQGNEQKEDKFPKVVQDKIDNRVKDVPVANNHGFFSEPETKFDSKYPYNHVTVTESGHIYEMDDTPGKERIHEYHSSGTFTEIYPKGTRVQKVVRDNYEFTLGDNYVNIKKIELDDEGTSHGGNLYVRIEGDVYEFVEGNVERQINGTLTENVGGNHHLHINGDQTITVEGSKACKIKGDDTQECYNSLVRVLGTEKKYTEGEIVLDSPKGINLQSIGGNIYINALPNPKGSVGFGSKGGNVMVQSGGSISMVGTNNIRVAGIRGDVTVTSSEGNVNLIAQQKMLMKSTVGSTTINSGLTTHIISNLNMNIESNQDISVRSLNLVGSIGSSTYIKTPNFQTVGNYFGVLSDNLAWIESKGSLYLDGSTTRINSDVTSINANSILDTQANSTNISSTSLTSITGKPTSIN